MAQVLLNAGVDIQAQSNYGWTALIEGIADSIFLSIIASHFPLLILMILSDNPQKF